MGILSLMFVLGADPADGLAKKMLPFYVKDVEGYSLSVESAPKQALELRKEPIFDWQNPARGDTQGVIFLWLRNGRPAALACIFSYPHNKLPGRQIVHELHALDSEKLIVKRDWPNQWKPGAGLARKELTEAPEPAPTRVARLTQMRRLAQEFSGHSLDWQAKRWELRLLPTPLYRYAAGEKDIVDGALFALMSSAGTDPEVLLLIEAKEAKGKLHWEFACGRFSDWELHVTRKEKEVFSAGRNAQDPLQLYRVFSENVVTPEGKVLSGTAKK